MCIRDRYYKELHPGTNTENEFRNGIFGYFSVCDQYNRDIENVTGYGLADLRMNPNTLTLMAFLFEFKLLQTKKLSNEEMKKRLLIAFRQVFVRQYDVPTWYPKCKVIAVAFRYGDIGMAYVSREDLMKYGKEQEASLGKKCDFVQCKGKNQLCSHFVDFKPTFIEPERYAEVVLEVPST